MRSNLSYINENIYQFCVINDLLINEEPSLELRVIGDKFGFQFWDNERTNKAYQNLNCYDKLLSQQTYEISEEGIKAFIRDFYNLLKVICFFSNLDIRDFYEELLS